MILRSLENRDVAQLETLFQRQGFAYQLPELEAFVAALVIADENDIARLTVCARPTTELYLVADPEWQTPGWRFQALKLIHEAMRQKLQGLGFSDCHIWLPPRIEKSFGRRLMRDFSWSEPVWRDFTRSTAP